MARARNIKPSIMDNEDLAELDPLARLLFIYLWMLADREGRVEDRPKRIAAQALAYDRSADANKLLSDLAEAGFIDRYVVDGVAVIQISKFNKHQTPHVRESASTLPEKVSSTAKVVPKQNLGDVETSPRSPESLFLNPESGFLNPESGLWGGDRASPAELHQPSTPEKPNPEPEPPAVVPSMAGAVCVALKSIGMSQVNPSNQTLKDLISAGADIGLFVEVGRECVEKQKQFAYLLATVKGRMSDDLAIAEKAIAVRSGATKTPNKQEALEARNRAVADAWATEMEAKMGVTCGSV